MKDLKISIVTACLNAENFLESTIESVLQQSALKDGKVELEYIIVDGGSRDRSLEIIGRYSSRGVILIQDDKPGMYHSLVRGFRAATGDICGYLNASDLYAPAAFDVLRHIFQEQRVTWLTGMNCTYNIHGHVCGCETPCRYRTRLFDCCLYGRYNWLPFVQQESTFWRTELLKELDLEVLAQQNYAGDYYLWSTFARKHNLYIVEAQLGGFKIHLGQKSENRQAYLDEIAAFVRRPPQLGDYILGFLDGISMRFCATRKKRMNPNYFLRYDHARDIWG